MLKTWLVPKSAAVPAFRDWMCVSGAGNRFEFGQRRGLKAYGVLRKYIEVDNRTRGSSGE